MRIVVQLCAKGLAIGRGGVPVWDSDAIHDRTGLICARPGRDTYVASTRGYYCPAPPPSGPGQRLSDLILTTCVGGRGPATTKVVRDLAALDRLVADDAAAEWIVCGGAAVFEHFASHPAVRRIDVVCVEPRVAGPWIGWAECDEFFPARALWGFALAGVDDWRECDDCRYRCTTYTRKVDVSPDNPDWARERPYLSLLSDVLSRGRPRGDRTGTGTRALFGQQLRFDLAGHRIPVVTTRSLSFKMVVEELLWFLRGDTDARKLSARGVRIWDANSSRDFLDRRGLRDLPEGDIGAGYGFQWRHFGAAYGTCEDDYGGKGVDQLAEVERLLREDPTSRRICMTGWNPAAMDRVALPPCHSCFVQFFVSREADGSGGVLSCHMTQRSVDMFLGLAVNVPSYALLTFILAARCGLAPGELVISTGDTHIYDDHVEQVRTQLSRTPLPSPVVRLDPSVATKGFEDMAFADFELVGYLCHPPISAKMSV